jgi:hypothetical protein
MRLATALILLILAPASGVAQVYFPPGVLGSTRASDTAAGLYSKFLQAAHEPSLWEPSQQDPTAESYRLLLLRAFDRPRLSSAPGETRRSRMVLPKDDQRDRRNSARRDRRVGHVVVVEVAHGCVPGHDRGRCISGACRRWTQT